VAFNAGGLVEKEFVLRVLVSADSWIRVRALYFGEELDSLDGGILCRHPVAMLGVTDPFGDSRLQAACTTLLSPPLVWEANRSELVVLRGHEGCNALAAHCGFS